MNGEEKGEDSPDERSVSAREGQMDNVQKESDVVEIKSRKEQGGGGTLYGWWWRVTSIRGTARTNNVRFKFDHVITLSSARATQTGNLRSKSSPDVSYAICTSLQGRKEEGIQVG